MLGPGRGYLELSDGAHWFVTHEGMQQRDHAANTMWTNSAVGNIMCLCVLTCAMRNT